jgi:hypothetical protein
MPRRKKLEPTPRRKAAEPRTDAVFCSSSLRGIADTAAATNGGKITGIEDVARVMEIAGVRCVYYCTDKTEKKDESKGGKAILEERVVFSSEDIFKALSYLRRKLGDGGRMYRLCLEGCEEGCDDEGELKSTLLALKKYAKVPAVPEPRSRKTD